VLTRATRDGDQHEQGECRAYHHGHGFFQSYGPEAASSSAAVTKRQQKNSPSFLTKIFICAVRTKIIKGVFPAPSQGGSVHIRLRPRSSWPGRIAVTLAATASVAGVVGTIPADASVYKSCTISKKQCAAARSARSIWASKGYPTRRGWNSWPVGKKYNFAGGRFDNREGELPRGATYSEYDVYPRAKGAHRDAFRIVVNRKTKMTWFSPNHYTDFYKL
jgi:hypothetical protein